LQLQSFLYLAVASVKIDEFVAARARDLVSLGYGIFDALRVAAAEFAKVDVMLTTDDRLLRRTARKLGTPQILLRNPLSWVKELGL
jgi:rRNA-processing protein FCF1